MMDEQFLDLDDWQVFNNADFWTFRQMASNVALVEGGGLRMTGDDTQVDGKYPGAGIVTTQTYLYGYFEVRCKFPPGDSGVWPAFWMWPSTTWDLSQQEIDVLEYTGGNIRYYVGSWLHSTGPKEESNIVRPGLANGFHKYACQWQAGKIYYFYDDVLVAVHTNLIPSVPMLVWLQMGINGWTGSPLPPEVFPATWEIDYVKVWQITE
jgi:endo-1,3-1,4-beta-glycanase ExoK